MLTCGHPSLAVQLQVVPNLPRISQRGCGKKDGDFRGDADAAAATLSLVVAFCEEILGALPHLRPYIEALQCLQELIGCVWACKICPSQASNLSVAAAKTLPKIQRSMDSCRHATEVALRFAFGKANPSMWHVAGHVHAGKETQIFQEIDDWKLGLCTVLCRISAVGNYPQQICKKAMSRIGWMQLCSDPPEFKIFQVSVIRVKQAQL